MRFPAARIRENAVFAPFFILQLKPGSVSVDNINKKDIQNEEVPQ